MPRAKKTKFIWLEDFVGMWLWVTDGSNGLVVHGPIVDPIKKEWIRKACDEGTDFMKALAGVDDEP